MWEEDDRTELIALLKCRILGIMLENVQTAQMTR